MNHRGLLVVISAPSGAGKSTVINEMINQKPGAFKYSISATTRKKRGSEEHGKHYYFLSEKEFLAKRDNNELFEWAVVHGNYYGTPKEPILKSIEAGETVLLDIDVQGGIEVKKQVKDDAFLLFISPPSMDILEERLRKRKTDSEETILKRLRNAKEEMRQSKFYDTIVVNDDLKETVGNVLSLIEEKQQKI